MDISNSSLPLTTSGERPNPARMSGYLTVQHLDIIALHDARWYQCNMLFFTQHMSIRESCGCQETLNRCTSGTEARHHDTFSDSDSP